MEWEEVVLVEIIEFDYFIILIFLLIYFKKMKFYIILGLILYINAETCSTITCDTITD